MEGKSHVKISQPEYRFSHLLVRSPKRKNREGRGRKVSAKSWKRAGLVTFGRSIRVSVDRGGGGCTVGRSAWILKLPNGSVSPADSAGSPASTSIVEAGVAASEVSSTPIVPTLLLSRNCLNTFKRRSLKYLTAIGTALSFIKPSLLLSSTATKQYAGSLPITLIDSFRSGLLHSFSRPSATTKQEFLRYLTTLLVVLPQPLNLPSRLLRAKLHPIATTTSKKTAANGPHTLLTLNVGPRLPIANVTSLLCRSPLPLRLKLLLPSLLPNHGCQRLLWLRRRLRLLNPIPPRKSLLPLWRLPQYYQKLPLPPPFCFLCSASTT